MFGSSVLNWPRYICSTQCYPEIITGACPPLSRSGFGEGGLICLLLVFPSSVSGRISLDIQSASRMENCVSREFTLHFLLSGCLSYCSIVVAKCHDQGIIHKEHLVRVLLAVSKVKSMIIMAGSLAAGKQDIGAGAHI